MDWERWQQIKGLFAAASELPAKERNAFLENACGADAELRGEVEKLLASFERAESFMERPAVGEVASLIVESKDRLRTGQRVAHYEIVRQLGAGGMGEVYLARDTRLNRQVALKVLPAHLIADKARLERFKQEACAASGLNHPGIITIHEIDADGETPFITTEYIEGETLRQRMARGSLNVSEALDVTAQLASALAVAHAAGVVHRDLKPENVMLRPDGIVKLLDFGLAKLTEAGPREMLSDISTRKLTGPGVIMGTVNYMSPEQAQGAKVDHRTDLWSLGVVLYEMLTGTVPFSGKTVNHTLVAIMESEPRPLANVPPELANLVLKLLTKEPSNRYQTAKALLADVRALQAGASPHELKTRSLQSPASGTTPAGRAAGEPTPVETQLAATQPPTASPVARAHPTSSAEYIVSEIKRHKRGTLVTLMTLVLITVAGVAYLMSSGRTTQAIDSVAVLPLVNAGGDPAAEYLSDGVTENIINRLSQLPRLRVMARSTVFRYKGRDADPRQIGRELGVRAVLTGKVSERGDTLSIQAELVDVASGAQLWGEQYNRRLADILSVQSEIAQQISERLRTKLTGEEQRRVTRSYTENVEAYRLYLRGRFEWNKFTPEGIQRSIDYYNQAIALDPSYALAYAGLSQSYGLQAHLGFVPPKEAYTKAKWAAEKALALDDTLSEAHVAVVDVKLFYEWDWPAVERECQRALELNPNSADAHALCSAYFKTRGRYAEALASLKRAEELDPLSPFISMEMAEPLLFAGRYDEAIAQGRKTLEIDPRFFLAHNVIARAYEQKGMYAEAVAEFKKMEDVLGRDPLILAALGHANTLAGERDKAQKALDELKEVSERRYVPSYWVAIVYAGLGDKDRAFEWLEKAYDERYFLMIWLKSEPRFSNLRSDPRFQDLLRRLGLAA